jgi:hypothetical protein
MRTVAANLIRGNPSTVRRFQNRRETVSRLQRRLAAGIGCVTVGGVMTHNEILVGARRRTIAAGVTSENSLQSDCRIRKLTAAS